MKTSQSLTASNQQGWLNAALGQQFYSAQTFILVQIPPLFYVPAVLYLWFKAFHIIFMVAWFVGLFYIFRLFVYHAKYQTQPEMARAYIQMEYKLLYIIMYPAMLLTTLFGILLITQNPAVLYAPWFQLKLLAVLLLIAYQILAGVTAKRFAAGDFYLSEKACRIINEIPTFLLIAIVILVIIKPGT